MLVTSRPTDIALNRKGRAMTKKDLPSPELLRKLLRYEPDTGKLFWKERLVDMFGDGKQSAHQNQLAWNGRYAGKEAFTSTNCGYKKGSILGKNYVAHRLVWVIHYGKYPIGDIDHINGNGEDNKISNLRDVEHSVNMKNSKAKSTNISGFNGVRWHTGIKKWVAYITINYIEKHIGSFDVIEDAIEARKNAELGHGFTDRHGKVSEELE